MSDDRVGFAARLRASIWTLWALARQAPRLAALTLGALATAAIALAWIWADRAATLGPPPAIAAAAVEIETWAGAEAAPLAIGRDALGQRPGPDSAEAAHLGLVFDPERGWLFRNIAAERRVLIVDAAGEERFARRWRLEAGDVVEIGETRLVANAVSSSRVVFAVARRDGLGRARSAEIAHYRGRGGAVVVRPLGATSPAARSEFWLDAAACGAPTGVIPALRGVVEALDVFSRRERAIAWIGGGVDCPDRIAAGAPPRALKLVARGDEVSLAPGDSPAGVTARFRRGAGAWTRFAEIERPIEGVERLILGRTAYAPEELRSGALRLTPVARAQRYWSPIAAEASDAAPAELWRQACAAAPALAADPLSACALIAAAATLPDGVALALTPPERRAAQGPWTAFAFGLALAAAFGALCAVAAHRALGRAALRRGAPLRLHRGDPRWTAALLGAALALCAAPLLAHLFAAPPRALTGPLLALQWALASVALLRAPERDGRMILFWFAISAVIAFGALCQALLAYASPDDGWLRFDARHQLSLSLTFFAATLALSLDMEGPRALLYAAAYGRGWGAVLLRATPALALILAFAAWAIVGREEGLGGFQPMEAGKFLAVLYFALAAARFHQERLSAAALARRGALIAGVALFALLYLILFAAVPGLTGDFSPVLILALAGLAALIAVGGALRAHRLVQIRARRARAAPPGQAHRRRRSAMSLLRGAGRPWMESVGVSLGVAGLGLAVLGAALVYDHVATRIDRPEAAGFSIPEQRVAVHLAPERHPELGAQTHRSRAAIAAACGLDPAAEGCLSAAGFGSSPRDLLALPAVQDDFIAAFFVNRFGPIAAIALMLAQILTVWLLLDAAIARYAWTGGDYADDAARQPLCFIALGAALMYAAHWLIAWSNAFGWGPIMGQPMTWISAGNSHILFMAAPFLLFSLWTLRLTARRDVRAAAAYGLAPPPLTR